MKKILLLYIANGGQWEDCFEDFFFWSLDYSLWVKMNLYYEKARDGFEQEEIFARVSVKSPLDLVGNTFTKEELEKAMKANGFKSNVSSYISTLKGKSRNKIVETATHQYRKI